MLPTCFKDGNLLRFQCCILEELSLGTEQIGPLSYFTSQPAICSASVPDPVMQGFFSSGTKKQRFTQICSDLDSRLILQECLYSNTFLLNQTY